MRFPKLLSILALIPLIASMFMMGSCEEDCPDPDPNDTLSYTYDPTPFDYNLPPGVPPPLEPADNQATNKGVQLGRMLFYDPILSADSSLACAGCHHQEFAFTDSGKIFSIGIDGLPGFRNAMAIFNMAWHEQTFWDGRANSVEHQVLFPVEDPLEMHNSWDVVETRLNTHPDYPTLFGEAFNTSIVTRDLVTKAIAQFERSILSFNSRYDQALRGDIFLNDQELRGFDIYFTERGDCFHCHGAPFMTDHIFHNNALDSMFTDLGLGAVTGENTDNGLFKAPTLRNIELTAPYMHDGRFSTLEEVIDHYSDDLRLSPTVDPLMKKIQQGGLQLTQQEKDDLIAFLKTFTDQEFLTNPDYSNPF